MEYLVIAVIGVFVLQILLGYYTYSKYKNKAERMKNSDKSKNAIPPYEGDTNIDNAYDRVEITDYFDGKKYFFEKSAKLPPLYSLYGKIKQFDISISPDSPILCGTDELSVLLEQIDPTVQHFFIVIADMKSGKTLTIRSEDPDTIEAAISGESGDEGYFTKLVFASDMKTIMLDYFAGYEIIKGFSMKPGKLL